MTLATKKTLIYAIIGLGLTAFQTGQASISTTLSLGSDSVKTDSASDKNSLGLLGVQEHEFEALIASGRADELIKEITKVAQHGQLWMIPTKNLAIILKHPPLATTYLNYVTGHDITMSSYNNYHNQSAYLLLKPILNHLDNIPTYKHHALISNLLRYHPDYIAGAQAYINKQIDKIGTIIGNPSTSQSWQKQDQILSICPNKMYSTCN